MRAVRPLTEYLRTPVGIDIQKPRLMWSCEGGVTQTAFQIVTEKWDSGKVESSSMQVNYPLPLTDRERVNWKIRLWDESGTPGGWTESYFEMGISTWRAKWITGGYKVDKRRRYPVDCFRKTFTAKKVVNARLYASACGVYEGCLNGRRIGTFILAPGHTDYRKRIQYQTYDVTELLQAGENELTFQLADGWYRGSCGAWGLRNQYGTETKLLIQLEMEYADGSRETVLSDESWAWSNDGPIRFADNKDGEVVNANDAPSYSHRALETRCDVIPAASNNVFVTEHERFKPIIITTPTGKTVLDFGQNIAGYASFSLNAQKGQKIRLRFGELLDENGEFTQKNIQCANKKITTPLQQVIYTCKDGRNEYKTRFAVFGFQYVLVETDVPFRPEDFTAIAVYSDLETTAQFHCSNDLLNRFMESTLWSTKNNSLDVPTDCPTRERHGWTGDSQIFCVTANYLMNYFPFARKHIRDLTDWQRKDGCYPQIAPYGGVDSYMSTMNGSVGWSDAGILIPYRLWKQYADIGIIRDNYDSMARYARFMMGRCGKLGLFAKPLGLRGKAKKYAVNAGQSYGEWAEPADVCPMKWTDMVAPHPEVSTAYTAFVMAHMEEIAQALGKTEDAALYSEYKKGCQEAYQSMRHTKDFPLDTDRQALLVRPLYMGLLDKADTQYAQKRLIQALQSYGWRLGTGFLSTPLILYVLSDFDLDAAYRVLENEEMPGWLFMPKNGATTIWESWEGTMAQGGIASLDHYSKGACLEWVFSVMCGVKVAGENHFVIAPRPGGHFSFADFSYQSIFGKISVHWEKRESGYAYQITVPANCTAEIRLSGQETQRVTGGEYHYAC